MYIVTTSIHTNTYVPQADRTGLGKVGGSCAHWTGRNRLNKKTTQNRSPLSCTDPTEKVYLLTTIYITLTQVQELYLSHSQRGQLSSSPGVNKQYHGLYLIGLMAPGCNLPLYRPTHASTDYRQLNILSGGSVLPLWVAFDTHDNKPPN